MTARWYYKGRNGKTPRLIVVHCTVSPEQGNGAEATANYFATTDRKASAHLVADCNSVVRCVADEDTAFGAAGANSDGLHLELVGQPTQSGDEWFDQFGQDMFRQAAPYVRAWSTKFGIPLRWLSVAEVAGSGRGLCTHADVSKAFPNVSTGHWDPGPNFPKERVLSIWRGPDPLADEDDMAELLTLTRGADGHIYVVSGVTAHHVSSLTDLDRWKAWGAKDKTSEHVDHTMFHVADGPLRTA